MQQNVNSGSNTLSSDLVPVGGDWEAVGGPNTWVHAAMWEIQMEFLAFKDGLSLKYGLSQPQSLWAFGEGTRIRKISLFLSLSVYAPLTMTLCLSNKQIVKENNE